jgi:YHS domain-containing protein
MIHRYGFMFLLLGMACCLPAALADDEKKETTDKPVEKAEKEEAKFAAKCPVSGADAKKEQSTKYKEKNVYFCCEKCKAAFETDNTKFTTKANHQLVQTKQYRQTVCPLSGGALNKEQFAKVAGVKVTFCCDKCKGKIEAASAEEQLNSIFADAVFAKTFTARKPGDGKKKKNADAAPEKGT